MERREIAVPVDGAIVAGEMVLPWDPPRGSVLLLSGSGPQDRHQTVEGQATFAILGDALATAGFVATMWDDRGVGRSTGDYLRAGAEVLVADVATVMRHVTGRTGIERHVLLGHSQGALIAPLAATATPRRVAGLILVGAAGRRGREVLLDQHRRLLEQDGLPASQIDRLCDRQGRLFDVLEAADRRVARGADDAERALAARLRSVLAEDVDGSDSAMVREIDRAVDDLLEWEWRFILRSDPAALVARTECPILVLTGDRDAHVDPVADVAGLRDAAGSRVQIRVLPDHDHLLRGPAGADGAPGRPFSEPSIRAIEEFLARIAR